jgi:hypothetical protein
VGKARVAEYGEPAPDIQTHNGHGAGPLADLSPYLRHPFPTKFIFAGEPQPAQILQQFAAASGNQQSTANKRKQKTRPDKRVLKISHFVYYRVGHEWPRFLHYPADQYQYMA